MLSALSSKAQRLFWTSTADADSPAIAFATALCRNPKEVSLLGEPSSPAKRQAVIAKSEHHMVQFPAPPHTTPRRLQWLNRYLASQTHFKVLVLVSYRDRVTRLQDHLKAAFRTKARPSDRFRYYHHQARLQDFFLIDRAGTFDATPYPPRPTRTARSGSMTLGLSSSPATSPTIVSWRVVPPSSASTVPTMTRLSSTERNRRSRSARPR